MNTMQQEFDAVVAHLYKQGRPAKEVTVSGEHCKYRLKVGDATLSCAVGCRIPDSAYDPAMDDINVMENGTSVTSVVSMFGSKLPEEVVAYVFMFADLQYVHDDHHHAADKFDLVTLESGLRDVARSNGLTFTVPTKGE